MLESQHNHEKKKKNFTINTCLTNTKVQWNLYDLIFYYHNQIKLSFEDDLIKLMEEVV